MDTGFHAMFGIVHVCVCICLFLIAGQTAEPIGTKLGTRIYLDLGIVLSKSRSEHHRHENRGAIAAKRDRGGANAIGMSIEVPGVTEAGQQRGKG